MLYRRNSCIHFRYGSLGWNHSKDCNRSCNFSALPRFLVAGRKHHELYGGDEFRTTVFRYCSLSIRTGDDDIWAGERFQCRYNRKRDKHNRFSSVLVTGCLVCRLSLSRSSHPNDGWDLPQFCEIHLPDFRLPNRTKFVSNMAQYFRAPCFGLFSWG